MTDPRPIHKLTDAQLAECGGSAALSEERRRYHERLRTGHVPARPPVREIDPEMARQRLLQHQETGQHGGRGIADAWTQRTPHEAFSADVVDAGLVARSAARAQAQHDRFMASLHDGQPRPRGRIAPAVQTGNGAGFWERVTAEAGAALAADARADHTTALPAGVDPDSLAAEHRALGTADAITIARLEGGRR